jgi:N-carbamoyl-L-amino-acid hydrolase
MSALPSVDAARVLGELRELRRLTADERGAQRVAWGPVWRRAREWLACKVEELGLAVERDAAGNDWVTLRGAGEHTLLLGGHLDSVPDGGWLDGPLGVLVSLEALRRHAALGTPPLTLALVDWADEEGARFGRSLLGSSAAAGSLDAREVTSLVDRDGVSLAEALAENGVDPDRVLGAHQELLARRPAAYLELHIEQGPVLEGLGLPAAAVVGTFGVERHLVRFTGQTAHSGSTPMPVRRDALVAASAFALEARAIGRRCSGDQPATRVVSTCGQVRLEPGIPTAVPGVCEISLDQRALDAEVLGAMLADARRASEQIAGDEGVEVAWQRLWSIEPRAFDVDLVELCAAAIEEVAGEAPRLPSGALHDAAEMAPLMPAVMMFVSSTGGLSHCREEDTPEGDLRAAIAAYQGLVDRVVTRLG